MNEENLGLFHPYNWSFGPTSFEGMDTIEHEEDLANISRSLSKLSYL